MNQYEIASVVGYWRSGATDEQIALVTGFSVWEVTKIITDYKNKIKQYEYSNNRVHQNF